VTHKEIKLVVKTILTTLFFVFMVWFFWSWHDVVSHQLCGGTQNPANLFRILLRT